MPWKEQSVFQCPQQFGSEKINNCEFCVLLIKINQYAFSLTWLPSMASALFLWDEQVRPQNLHPFYRFVQPDVLLYTSSLCALGANIETTQSDNFILSSFYGNPFPSLVNSFYKVRPLPCFYSGQFFHFRLGIQLKVFFKKKVHLLIWWDLWVEKMRRLLFLQNPVTHLIWPWLCSSQKTYTRCAGWNISSAKISTCWFCS